MNFYLSILFYAIAGVISGALSALGLGAGTVLLLYLALFTNTPQLTSQGINLLFFIPCAIIALIFHFKEKLINFRVALFCALGGILGTIVGLILSTQFHPDILRKIFGGFLLIIGIREVIIGIKEVKKKKNKVES
jgi:uncharacterized membrane protein YfcA